MAPVKLAICPLSSLEADSPYHFVHESKHYILVRKPDGVFALDGVCTHEYAELWNGFVTDDTITCPLHLSQFDIKTGEVISPPAESPLRTYTTEISDGMVYVIIS